jgi:hypothetical protein
MAVTGHVTGRMVAKYTKDASKRKRASAAILKLENVSRPRSAKRLWE